MILEGKDLSLLIALQQNPLAPASKLAKAIDISTPTVISKLNSFKEERTCYNVSSDIIPETLELELLDILLHIDKLEDVEFFEKIICLNHPYTHYRIRSYGYSNGLFVQFRIPKDSKYLLIELLDHLKKIGRIQNYSIPAIIKNSKTIFTRANLRNWDNKKMNWFFDWNTWEEKLENHSSKMLERKIEKSYLSQLDKLDIALLQEITMDSRRKNTEIMKALKLDKSEKGLPQKISRKLKFINNKIVLQNRVFLKWEAFEIYNSFLVLSECNQKTRNKLQNLLDKNPIPFESNFKLTENGFRWYIRCPASHFSNVSEIIWKLSNKAEFYFLDYKKSVNYGLWKGAFDVEKKKWRLDLMKKEEVIK